MTSANAKNFTFGRNWQKFLAHYTPERQQIAKQALLDFLKLENLKGKSFLDIGSGSGIHSAAAFLAGAERVHSFDYDPDSVAATRQLHRHLGSPAHWTIEQGSVLDDAYMARLGAFEVVYSWGVLHHTGDQWHALRNAFNRMHETSRAFIALYAKETYPDWEYWLDVKQRYNRAGALRKRFMELRHIWISLLYEQASGLLKLPFIWYDYKQLRGMSLMTDVRDWLGGWPTEFSSVDEITAFAADKFALALVNLGIGEGNNEFLFVKQEQVQKLGLLLCRNLSIFTDDTLIPASQPVWLFGTAKGADYVYRNLHQKNLTVAGFIDITPTAMLKHGLPVLSFDQFAAATPKDTSVILTTKYLNQHLSLLNAAGFTNILNALTWIRSLNGPKQSKI